MVSRMRQHPASTPAAADGRTPTLSARQAGWLLGLPAGLAVLIAAGGATARLALRYERGAVLGGEYWRLLTGHFTHYSLAHLLLNLAGLVLIARLFRHSYGMAHWLLIGLASLVSIDLAFVFYEPHVQWYVGLSGLLHGLMAAGALAWWQQETKALALALSVLLAAKLVWEQMQGPLPLSGDMPVMVDAHLFGALGGLAAALPIRLGLQDWWGRARSL